MYRGEFRHRLRLAAGAASGSGKVVGMFAAVLVSGCAVGPDFEPPGPPDIARYTDSRLPAATASSDVRGGEAQYFSFGRDLPGEWWTLFHSRHLNRLIERAIAENANLQAAQSTLRQAQETALAQAGTLLPQVDLNGSAARQQVSPAQFGQSGKPLLFNLFNTTVNVSYALDVWGGKRRALEASQAQADFQRFQVEATFLTLTANVVTTAIQEASLRGQIKATQDIIKGQTEQLEVLRGQFDLGGVPRSDVLAQEADLAATQATLPPLEKQLEQQRSLLATLTGRFPSAAEREAFTIASLALPRNLPVSLPSRLVQQRPDLRAAEEQLHQASANVGVATANLLPQFNITGDYGSTATKFASLFSPGTAVWSIGGSLAQPIFHGGTLLHQKQAAIAAFEAAQAQYRDTVLNAVRNVSDSLRAIEKDAVALKAQERAARTANDSLALAREQFKAGAITYLTLLNAQRTQQQALIGLAQAQAARYADTAALFQALGGGWWNRRDVPPPPRPHPLVGESGAGGTVAASQ
ncbi:MAG TPA: efflux transporter outer membrane subunit [Xanthobacteraceae bacterium]|nr:efflux transporter outer membrane subunit [Xanthobacteraceae bacterium]